MYFKIPLSSKVLTLYNTGPKYNLWKQYPCLGKMNSWVSIATLKLFQLYSGGQFYMWRAGVKS